MSVSVTKIISLRQSTIKLTVRDDSEDATPGNKTLGAVLSDDNYAWLASGPHLEVVHTKTGKKIGSWTFGWVLKDSLTEIIHIDEIRRPDDKLPLLVIALDCEFNGGMICIFDFISSKIMRTIHILKKITVLHVIESGLDVFTLPSPLRTFDGIIAVGLAGGDIFLIDICREVCDEAQLEGGLSEIRDELNPCQLLNITTKDLKEIEYHKQCAVRNNNHLALHLNAVFDSEVKHFTLKSPKGDDLLHVNKSEVEISCLYYCSQLGSLVVGYNFGAFQLYDLMCLKLVYTSPVCEEHVPISHFTIQEPADDPRAVCYIWAVYSRKEDYPSCLPIAVMYSFCYETKEYHEGYGYLYQNFLSASVLYQMELAAPNGHHRGARQKGGTCLRLNSILQGVLNREGLHDSNEDSLTLSVFVWNVWFSNKEIHTFMCVFDLNQWYKEQMPSLPPIAKYTSNYMLQIQLNDVVDSATNMSSDIIDAYLNKDGIQQFRGAQRLEEHFYSNSISFDISCLRDADVIFLHNHGIQKALIAQIEFAGPLCLVQPAKMYQEVVASGLVPLFIELPVNTPVSTNQQREVMLGTALEHHLLGWLCKCASEWANGSFLSTGCSLDFLINWAFQRATTLKINCDKYCKPLFDLSQNRLDCNITNLLNSCARQLENIHFLYSFIMKKLFSFVSNRALLEEQFKSLETVSDYFHVLQWLLNVGLLPECPPNVYPVPDDLGRVSAPYPADVLIEFYNHRRALLKILNEKNYSSSESVLFIDALIESECGGSLLQQQWRDDGGNGLYPPPSSQSLLRTYLIDNVHLSYKHSVIIYLFLDLAMVLSQKNYKPVVTHLIKFPAVFKVSPSVIKLTQAFWQLDHGDFNTAMGLLSDPLIPSEELKTWHHKIALRSLMLQDQHRFALLYVQIRKPVFEGEDDILTAISLYVANNMLDEAFYFERHFTGQVAEDRFLSHFLNECKKNDKLRAIIYRPLPAVDENNFLKYLTNKPITSGELPVYYHILRSHFIEAFDKHSKAVSHPLENQGLFGQEAAVPREKLVHNLKRLLPDINRHLLNLCHREKAQAWLQISRPTPMSVFVNNLNENAHYKSTLLGAALSKARETFNDTLNKSLKIDTEGTPFLRTPIVTSTSKRSSAVIVNPRLIELEDETSPPVVKRLKLSPHLNNTLNASIATKLDTPLVVRKTPTRAEENKTKTTPQSILKVKSFNSQTSDIKDDGFKDDFEDFRKIDYTPVTSLTKKQRLVLSPRKSLKSTVRFEGLQNSSSSSPNNTSNSLRNLTDSHSILSSEKVTSDVTRSTETSKSTSADEIFYSPNTSLEEIETAVDTTQESSMEEKNKEAPSDKIADTAFDNKSDSLQIKDSNEDNLEEMSASPKFSPKGRKSYKTLLDPNTPVRSSARLSKRQDLSSAHSEPNITQSESEGFSDGPSTCEDMTQDSLATSPALPKLRPRKSLCRKVLETNTLNRVFNSPVDSPKKLVAKESDSAPQVEESTEVVSELKRKSEDGELSFSSPNTDNLSIITVDSDTFSFGWSICSDHESTSSVDTSCQSDHSNAGQDEVDAKLIEQKSESEADRQEVVLSAKPENHQEEENGSSDEERDLERESPEDNDDLQHRNITKDLTQQLNNLSNSKLLEKHVTFEADSTVNQSTTVGFVLESAADVDGEENISKNKIPEVQDGECNDESDLIYGDLDVPENEKSTDKLISKEKENNKQETVDESASNRPIDPEMNVFEITDDLSLNDGFMVEEEVALEENYFCYGQQNTLENVIEENIASVSATSLNAFEKNVFSVTYSSEEKEIGRDTKSAPQHKVEEVEIIEIGSSSDDEVKSNNSESEDSFLEDKQSLTSSEEEESQSEAESYERIKNIYESFGEANETRKDLRRSETSDSEESSVLSDESVGLFKGDIIYLEDEGVKEASAIKKEEVKKDEDESSKEETSVDEHLENKSEVEEAEKLELEELKKAEDSVVSQTKKEPNDEDKCTEQTEKTLKDEELAKDKSSDESVKEKKGEPPSTEQQIESKNETDFSRGVCIENANINERVTQEDRGNEVTVPEEEIQAATSKATTNSDDSPDMEELHYSFEESTSNCENKNNEGDVKESDHTKVEVIHKSDIINDTDAEKLQCVKSNDEMTVEEVVICSEGEIREANSEALALAEILPEPGPNQEIEHDVLDIPPSKISETKSTKSRTRSASVSSTTSSRSTRRRSQKNQECSTKNRITTKVADASQHADEQLEHVGNDDTLKQMVGSETLELTETNIAEQTGNLSANNQIRQTGTPEEIAKTVCEQVPKVTKFELHPTRVLRSRAVSIEEPGSSGVVLRKRSISVDVITQTTKQRKKIANSTDLPTEETQPKKITKRANSSTDLPKIPEEEPSSSKESSSFVKRKDTKKTIKRSNSTDLPTVSEEEPSMNKKFSSVVEEKQPKKITKASNSSTDLPKIPEEEPPSSKESSSSVKGKETKKTTKRSNSTVSEEEPSSSKQSSSVVEEKQPKKITKASNSSTDLPKIPEEEPPSSKESSSSVKGKETKKTIIRSSSTELPTVSEEEPSSSKQSSTVVEEKQPRKITKPSNSSTGLPKIPEEEPPSSKESRSSVRGKEAKKITKRSTSTTDLSNIPEVDLSSIKKSSSVVEGYSMNRRVTRKQANILKTVSEERNLQSMDPMVLLDRLPFDGKPDPEEQKIYESSPSSSVSGSISPEKSEQPTRRLRSASETSYRSERSMSHSPARSIRSRSRQKSVESNPNQSSKAAPVRKKLKEIIEDTKDDAAVAEPRTTRSKAKSTSSVKSDSSASETKSGTRRKRTVSENVLPDIEEEAEKSVVPKKRMRKNSSQK